MGGKQKFCMKCGAPHPLDALFCSSCGTKFQELEPAGTQKIPPPVDKAGPPPLQKNNSDFITLSCPNCGGKLQITADMERFACQFCGYEHIVRRSGGMVSLEPVVQAMNMMGVGMSKLGFSSEKQAAEQTIARLKEEIAGLSEEIAKSKKDQRENLSLGIILMICGVGSCIAFYMLLQSTLSGKISSDVETFIWLFLIVGWIIPGSSIVIFSKPKRRMTEAQQELAQKKAELEQNYEIVRRT